MVLSTVNPIALVLWCLADYTLFRPSTLYFKPIPLYVKASQYWYLKKQLQTDFSFYRLSTEYKFLHITEAVATVYVKCSYGR